MNTTKYQSGWNAFEAGDRLDWSGPIDPDFLAGWLDAKRFRRARRAA